jgi:hypothetical protein
MPIFDRLVRNGSGAGDSATGYAVGVIGMDPADVELRDGCSVEALALVLGNIVEATGTLEPKLRAVLVMKVVGVGIEGAATDCCGGLGPATGTIGATSIEEVAAGCVIGCTVGGGGATMGTVLPILGIGTGLLVVGGGAGDCVGIVTSPGGMMLVMGMAGGIAELGGGT